MALVSISSTIVNKMCYFLLSKRYYLIFFVMCRWCWQFVSTLINLKISLFHINFFEEFCFFRVNNIYSDRFWFFFSLLNILFHFLMFFIISNERSAIILFFVSFDLLCPFLQAALNIYSSFIFSNLIIVCGPIVFPVFVLLLLV